MTDSDVFEDDFLPEEQQRATQQAGRNPLRALRYWWMRLVAGNAGPLAASMERFGVPLYDLTADGHEIHDDNASEYSGDRFSFHRGRRWRPSRRALKLGGAALVLACATVFLLVQILGGSHGGRRRSAWEHPRLFGDSALDPNARYSNGSAPFYPLTVVLVVPGLGACTVARHAAAMPLVAQLVRGEPRAGSRLLAGHSLLAGGEAGMRPQFPLTHDAEAWSMFSGLAPGAHGVLYDSEPSNATAGVLPVWRGLERAFASTSNGFRTAVDSEVVRGIAADHAKYAPAYYLDRGRPSAGGKGKGKGKGKSRAKPVPDAAVVDWVLGLVDSHDISTRPQLVLASLVEYSEAARRGWSGEAELGEGTELAAQLAAVDQIVARLLLELQRRNMRAFSNVLLVGDYAFARDAVRGDRVLELADLLPADTAKLVSASRVDESLLTLTVPRAHKNEVYGALLHGPHNASLEVELGGSLPAAWKNQGGEKLPGTSGGRPGDILVAPREPGWALVASAKDSGVHRDERHWYRLGGYPLGEGDAFDGALLAGVGPAFARRKTRDERERDGSDGTGGDFVNVVRRAREAPQNTAVYALIAEMCGLAGRDRNAGYAQADSALFESVDIVSQETTEQEYEETAEQEQEYDHDSEEDSDHEDGKPEEEWPAPPALPSTMATPAAAPAATITDISETPSNTPDDSSNNSVNDSDNNGPGGALDQIIADGAELVDDIIEWLQAGLSDLVDGSGQNQNQK